LAGLGARSWSYFVTDALSSVVVLLTANGYSSAEAAEIVLFARKNASPDQWIKVLAVVGAERARYQQALGLAFPQAD
jgi:hypothetical protein